MLDKLRAYALAHIAANPHCTLSTTGPAGLQASVVTCMVREECIYLLLPSTADHLFNLEHSIEVVLTTAAWQLRGAALVLNANAGRHGTVPANLRTRAQSEGYQLVEIFPLRMHVEPASNRRYRETIDFEVPQHVH